MDKTLAELVAAQQKNLDSLLELSKKLLAALKKDAAGEKIDALLAERSLILEAVGKLDAKLKPAVEETKPAPDPAFEKLGRTVEEIMKVEAECAAEMEQEKSGLAERLHSLNKGGAALKGYRGGDVGPAPKFLSIKK